MSKEGKLARGKKWLKWKNTKFWGEVQGDPNKMCDVDYYLGQSVPEPTKSKGKR